MSKLLGNNKRGRLFVVSAPAGTGKTTLVDRLTGEFPSAVVETCSSTTRTPREHERPNKDYEFLSIPEFEQKVHAGAFVEHAQVFGNYYGTRKEEVEKILSSGKHAVLVIDTQGARQIMQNVDRPTATFIFISPPSVEELTRRLQHRHTESEAKIKERLSWADQEMAQAPLYDYYFINDDIDTAYQVLRSILIACEHQTIQENHGP